MIVPQFRSSFPGSFGRNAHQNRYKPPGHSPLGRFREYKAHLHGSFQHIQQLIVHQKAVGVDLGDPDFPLGKLPDDLLETPAYQRLATGERNLGDAALVDLSNDIHDGFMGELTQLCFRCGHSGFRISCTAGRQKEPHRTHRHWQCRFSRAARGYYAPFPGKSAGSSQFFHHRVIVPRKCPYPRTEWNCPGGAAIRRAASHTHEGRKVRSICNILCPL